MKEFKQNENAGTLRQHLADPYIRRHNSGTKAKFTVEIGRAIIDINLEYLGELTNAQIRDKLIEAGHGRFDEDSVRRWSMALGVKERRQYLHPTLNRGHKIDRLDWTLNEIEENAQGCLNFSDNYNAVHIDEAFYYLRKDGARVKMYKKQNGVYQTFETVRTKSKRFVGKVMYIAALCRPHPTYAKTPGGADRHDGKIVLRSFTDVGTYTRGRLMGQEKIVNVSVTGEEYSRMIHREIVPAIMQNMWWFKRGSGKPEAGQTIFIQQDGASPHTCKFAARSLRQLESEAFYRRHGFRFRVVTQPAQSPDLNVLDLAFWHSNKTTLKGRRWAALQEMMADVAIKWDEYPREKVEAAFRILYTIYRGILASGGDNNFSRHGGDRRRRAQGLGPDTSCLRELREAGRSERDRLMAELNLRLSDSESEGSDSEDRDAE